MGSGAWTSSAFTDYTVATRGSIDAFNSMNCQQILKAKELNTALNPYQVMRECCDSEEHPNTIPVILALDVTGSMGSAAAEVAKKLNVIMENLYKEITDVEFLPAAVGDFSYDDAPFQAGQFESDIRVAEQVDKIYFEGGGGGNYWESYTAAWYFGLHHTKLDCWNRGKKGIIITLGDEPLNPYLPKDVIATVFGDNLQEDVDTDELYKKVSEKYNVYHIAINDKETSYECYKVSATHSWISMLGDNYKVSTIDGLANMISDIIIEASTKEDSVSLVEEGEEISW